jgi:hypothetical protein
MYTSVHRNQSSFQFFLSNSDEKPLMRLAVL